MYIFILIYFSEITNSKFFKNFKNFRILKMLKIDKMYFRIVFLKKNKIYLDF